MQEGKRTLLVIGGTGVLGRALLSERPEDLFVINVSRKGKLDGEHVLNVNTDITSDPEGLFKYLAETVRDVDVLIPMAYDKSFSSVNMLNRTTFLHEIELNTYIPLYVSILCARYFWSKKSREENFNKRRKVINVSSGAAFGSTRPELATYSGTKAALNVMTEYLHTYLFSTYGVSAGIVAPGSLQNAQVMNNAVQILWEMQNAPLTDFTLRKVY